MTVRGYVNPGALGDLGDAEFMLIDLERRAVAAVTAVIREHDAAFVAALAPLGIDWHTVMMPEWKRALMPADVERLMLIDPPEFPRVPTRLVCYSCGKPASDARGSELEWRCAECGGSTVRVVPADEEA